MCARIYLCPQDWSLCFPLSCGSLIIKFPWPSRSDSLGIPSPFVGSPGWGAWCRALNLHNSGRTFLVLLFSSLWMTQPSGYGIWFYCNCAPPTFFLQLCLCLWMWRIFFFFLVGSSSLLLVVVQQLVVILVLFQEEMSAHPFTPPSWTGSLFLNY